MKKKKKDGVLRDLAKLFQHPEIVLRDPEKLLRDPEIVLQDPEKLFQTFEEADTILWDSEDDLGGDEAVIIGSSSEDLTQVM